MRAQNRTEMKDYELRALPPKPEHTPANNEAVRMCVNAWHELDGDRHVGMAGAGSVPYTALVTWAETNNVDRENFELLRYVIRELDNDRAIAEQSRRKSERGKKS